MHPIYDELVDAARDACQRHYGPRLVSVAVFGSVGRGTNVQAVSAREKLPLAIAPLVPYIKYAPAALAEAR